MRGNVVEYLLIGDAAEQTRAIFFDQQCRLSHHIAPDAAPTGRLNGVTRDARHAIVIERPFDMRVLRQRAGKKGRRVVTRFAMTREFNSFLRLQILDVLLIERLAKSISMRGLSPLRVRVRVTISTALRRNEHIPGNECSRGRRGIPGRKRVGTKLEVVSL